MKTSALPLTFVFAIILTGSNTIQKENAKAVAETENAFAKTSRETNTVNAFQNFMADDAVMFRNGEAVNGKKLWSERKPDSTLLDWWPILAEASRAGDLGYTTGPYQFFNSRKDSVPAGNGYYSTIWQKQANGAWKIKIDLGVRFESIRQLPRDLLVVEESTEKIERNESITTIDANYNSKLNKTTESFHADLLASVYRIHRPLIGPSINETENVKRAEAGVKFQFETIGGEAASSHDLAYSYGNVVRSSKSGDQKANYLRVWKMQNAKWRIVLDVVTEG